MSCLCPKRMRAIFMFVTGFVNNKTKQRVSFEEYQRLNAGTEQQEFLPCTYVHTGLHGVQTCFIYLIRPSDPVVTLCTGVSELTSSSGSPPPPATGSICWHAAAASAVST